MKACRIAIDARPLAFPMVGITRYTYELVRRLVVADGSHQWYLYLDRAPVHVLPELPNLHIRTGSMARAASSTLFAQWVFPQWAKQDGIDIFWSPRHHLPRLLPRRIKTLLTIHDMVWQEYPETMARAGLWAERLLMPPSLKRADAIVTVSDATREDVCAFMPSLEHKVTSIHSGLTRMAPAAGELPDQQEPYFLFVGTLEPRKNLERLLQSFAQPEIRASDTRLLIVGGEGWGEVALSSLIYELQLDKQVSLMGRVEEEKLAALYRGATALVMPSLYEGFGLPLLEAMGLGVPVITSKRGAMAEIAGKGGMLVDPLETKEIANALLNMRHPQTRQQYAEQARQRAAQFDWDNTAREMLTLLENL